GKNPVLSPQRESRSLETGIGFRCLFITNDRHDCGNPRQGFAFSTCYTHAFVGSSGEKHRSPHQPGLITIPQRRRLCTTAMVSLAKNCAKLSPAREPSTTIPTFSVYNLNPSKILCKPMSRRRSEKK